MADGRLSAAIKRFAEIKLLMCRCSPDGVLIEKRLTFGFFGWIEKFLCNRYFPVGFLTSASGENDGGKSVKTSTGVGITLMADLKSTILRGITAGL